MKQLCVVLVAMVSITSLAWAQFTTIDDVNKPQPLGSLIAGPTNLGVQGNVVNPFTGSASLSIPLLPGIGLMYSSSNMPQLMNYENRDMQASSVGAGWTLELGSIVADLKGTTDISDDDWYYIAPDGSRTKIVQDAGGTYRLQNNPYWKINLSTFTDQLGNTMVCGVMITTDDGSQMKFGDFQIGTKQANRYTYYWGPTVTDFSSSSNNGQICYRWDLSQVVDPHGVTISDIYYTQEQVSVNGVPYTRASYPNYILNDRTGQKINFVLSARNSNEYQNIEASPSKIQLYDTLYISQIQVFSSSQASNPFLTIGLDTMMVFNGTKTKRLLKSITEYDANNNPLPSLNFAYDPSNNYVLNSIQNPAGGFVKINGTDTSFTNLNQQGTYETLVPAQPSVAFDNCFKSSSSGTTIASYGIATGQLQIEKWIGTWKSYTISVPSSPLTDATSNAWVCASDNHVVLVYRTADKLDMLCVYDWRPDNQTWNLSISGSSCFFDPNYHRLVPALSTSGAHFAVYMVDTVSHDVVPPCIQVWEWQESSQSWQWLHKGYVGTTGNWGWGVNSFQMTESMVLINEANGVHAYQFGAPSIWNEIYNSETTSDYIYLTKNYIGRYSNGSLCAYVFQYNSSGVANCTPWQLGVFSSGLSNPLWTSYPVFIDDRILLCEYHYNNGSPDVDIHLWKWNGSTFDVLPNLPGWTNFYSDPNSSWNFNCQIDDDWVFILQNENWANYSSGGTEARVWGYVWDGASGTHGTYDTVGTYTYFMLNQDGTDNYDVLQSSSTTLTQDYFIVNSLGRPEFDNANGTIAHPARDGFVDVFALDRTSPSNWSVNTTRIFSADKHGYYSDDANDAFGAVEYNRSALLVGYSFVGISSDNYGEVKAKLFHGVDKNWTDNVSAYTLTQTRDSSGIGPTMVVNYTYDPNPTFDPNLVTPGFATVTTSDGQNGSSKLYFNNSLSSPYLLGAPTKTESYNQSGSLIQQSILTYSTYLPAWYLYQIQKTSESSMLDGVTKSINYLYNSSNGQISQTMQRVNSLSGPSLDSNLVASVTYAFQQPQYSSMQSTNMLVQPYETRTASASLSQASVTASSGGPTQSQFTSAFTQTASYYYNYSNGTVEIGTSPGGSDIFPGSGSGSGSSTFTANAGTTYYITATGGVGSLPQSPNSGLSPALPSNGATITVYFNAGRTLSIQRTEYDANNFPVRTLVSHDGSLTNWDTTNCVISRDSYGNVIESQNIDDVHSVTKYGYNGTLPLATITNASNSETMTADFENQNLDGFQFAPGSGTGNGNFSSQYAYDGQLSYEITQTSPGTLVLSTQNNLSVVGSKTYTISTVVKSPNSGSNPVSFTAYFYNSSGGLVSSSTFNSSGLNPPFGWTLFNNNVTAPSSAATMAVYFTVNTNTNSNVYFDNIRIAPSNAYVTTQAYDPQTFNVTSKTNADNVTTYYKYDAFGRPTEIENNDGAVLSTTAYYYSRDHNGGSFSPSYPNYTRTITYPGGTSPTPIISTTYTDGLGRTLQTHSRNGANDIVTAVDYDNAGRQFLAWKPYSTSDTLYDSSYSTTAPAQYGFSNPYTETDYYSDPLSRVQCTKPAGWTSPNEWVTTSYGSATINGALLSYTDQISTVGSNTGQTESRVYTDNLGRHVRTENLIGNPAMEISTTIYNMLGKPVTTTDPNGYVSTNQYDFLGRLTQGTNVDNGTSQYLYDKAGRLRFMMDANGNAANPNNVLYWKYDNLGRVIEKGYISQAWSTMAQYVSNGSYPTTPATWRKKYDYDDAAVSPYAKGKLCQVQTNNDSDSLAEVIETFTYDKYGNVLTDSMSVPDFTSGNYVTSYTYDNLGRVTQVQYPSQAQK